MGWHLRRCRPLRCGLRHERPIGTIPGRLWSQTAAIAAVCDHNQGARCSRSPGPRRNLLAGGPPAAAVRHHAGRDVRLAGHPADTERSPEAGPAALATSTPRPAAARHPSSIQVTGWPKAVNAVSAMNGRLRTEACVAGVTAVPPGRTTRERDLTISAARAALIVRSRTHRHAFRDTSAALGPARPSPDSGSPPDRPTRRLTPGGRQGRPAPRLSKDRRYSRRRMRRPGPRRNSTGWRSTCCRRTTPRCPQRTPGWTPRPTPGSHRSWSSASGSA